MHRPGNIHMTKAFMHDMVRMHLYKHNQIASTLLTGDLWLIVNWNIEQPTANMVRAIKFLFTVLLTHFPALHMCQSKPYNTATVSM